MQKSLYPKIVLLCALTLGVNQCASIPVDSSAMAATAGDKTIVFEGADSVSTKGYLFIQKTAGTLPIENITLIVPPTNCKRANCVEYQFFRKDGTPGFGGGIPVGVTQAQVKLSDIVGHTDAVTEANDDAEYSAIVRFYYVGNDGTEYSVLQNGFIRVNVLAVGYTALPCNSPQAAWTVAVGPLKALYSTAGRSALCLVTR